MLQEIGFGLTRDIVSHIIMQYLNDIGRPNPFQQDRPGKDWWLGFLRRWPSLTERKPQHLPANRATALTEAAVSSWIDKVTALVTGAGLADLSEEELGKRMWNCDETAFATDTASKKVLSRRGERNIHETGGGSGREYVTVLGCGAADGTRLPPYVVYKGKNLWSSWTMGGPAGTLYTASESGWMERPNFLDWFKKLFLSAVSGLLESGPVLLFIDGHLSHISLQLIRLARERGVMLLCLPSHTTHALQPLDVGVYGPLKGCWGKILKRYKLETCAEAVSKTEFPGLLKQLWEESFTQAHLKAGFRKAGLCPVSKESISKASYAPSLPVSLAAQEAITSKRPRLVATSESEDSGNHDQHHIVVQISCCDCIHHSKVTPARVYLCDYFTRLIGCKKAHEKKTARRRIKPMYSGEALTENDIFERLEEEDKQKQEKVKQKKEKAKQKEEKAKQKEEKAKQKQEKAKQKAKERAEKAKSKKGLY